MKIALVGPGAIGGTLAAWLAQNPAHEIFVCARTPFSELVVETPRGQIRAQPRVLTNVGEASAVDWVIVTTKAYDAAPTARWFPALLGPATRVAVVQNGVEHVERFAAYVNREKLLPAIIDCPAERTAPGKIWQRGDGWIAVPENAAARDFAALFSGTCFDLRVTADFVSVAWGKLCLNSAGALSALLLKSPNVTRIPEVAAAAREIVRECIDVGRAEGAKLDDALAEQVVRSCQNAPDNSLNSMHADRLAGRPMEIEARNGAIVRFGEKHGIATPMNRLLVALLKATEATAW
jgi:2-dehydropantoate 2-reductase